MDLPPEIQRRLAVLKSKRTGKKASITKRIKQLAGMVEAGGCSRTLMQDMMGKLAAVYEELEVVCEEIAQLSELHDVSDPNNDIEEIRFNVDSCIFLSLCCIPVNYPIFLFSFSCHVFKRVQSLG